MIIMRLSNSGGEPMGGKYCDISGGNPKYEYDGDKSGWFPIESMSFGFQGMTESETGKKDTPPSTGTTTNTGKSAQTSGGGKTGKSGSQEAFTKISVSRFVDLATPSLMGFAMSDRKITKSDVDKLRKADIHCLHSVMVGDTTQADVCTVFPYLLITLEEVLIKGWNINATGDERPSETLEVWYNKAALRYFATSDGKKWNQGEIKGWDQNENGPWEISEGNAPKYFKSPTS